MDLGTDPAFNQDGTKPVAVVADIAQLALARKKAPIIQFRFTDHSVVAAQKGQGSILLTDTLGTDQVSEDKDLFL